MRPCNQCRKPVENRIMICEECKAYNEAHGLEPPKTIHANTEGDLEPPAVEPEYDRSLKQVANVLYVVVMLIGALLGLALFGGFSSFLLGGLLGLILCAVFLRTVFLGA